jgi:hypothetical protein
MRPLGCIPKRTDEQLDEPGGIGQANWRRRSAQRALPMAEDDGRGSRMPGDPEKPVAAPAITEDE